MKKLVLMLHWFGSLLYLETVLRLSNDGSFWAAGLYVGTLFNASIVTIGFSALEFLKSERLYRVINYVLMSITCILFASQLVYFQLMRTYYTIYSAGNTGRVLEFAGIAAKATIDHFGKVTLLLLPILLMPVLFRTIKNLSFKKVVVPILIGTSIVFHLFGLLVVNLGDRSENTPYSMYYNMSYPEFSVNNIGLLTTIRVDIKRMLFGFEPKLDMQVAEDDIQIETSEAIETTSPVVETTTSETTEPIIIPPKVYEKNVLQIDFEQLIQQETDKTLLEMHQYFNGVTPTMQNEMTGKFSGYNLIFITAEGFSHLAVRKDVTPTLYKMMHEGIHFKEFYTPIWGVSTTDGEYVATTSLIPKSGVWSYRYSRNNHMPFAMGNQLKALGYETRAYHNHTYTYYDRHLTHPNMGYDYKGIGNGLVMEDQWPRSDLEMIEVTLPEYLEVEKFHTYYMTVSGHMFYDFGGNQMASKNAAFVKDLSYSDAVKAYLATQIELDRAMAYLLEHLERAGKLDKTLIVISSDHYPYGLSQREIEELNGSPVDSTFELYRNALIMYSGDMDPLVVEKPASSLDILPTLSNMMGIPYDSRLLMGKDIFSNTTPLVVFNNQSFITDVGRYSTVSKKFIKNTDLSDDEAADYRSEISRRVSEMFYYSSKILEKNYYGEVFE